MNRILVVDDSSDIRLLLSMTLKAAGYTVSEATDGDEVLAATLSFEPNMILLEVAMSRVDGFKALAMLKHDPRTKDIPVIMVTAKGHPSDLETARTLGAIDYINKPWAHGEVERRVQWAITSVQRKRDQAAKQNIDMLAG